MIETNTQAPHFTLPDQNGKEHSIQDYKGNWVLLYFYPKDDTPGCTKEACGLRDSYKEYKDANITILGVSTDSVESHKKFEEKYELPFTLLADTDKEVVKKYDVWKPKRMFGKEFLGTTRTSFLINPQGLVVKVYPKVKPTDHAQEVLEDVKSLS